MKLTEKQRRNFDKKVDRSGGPDACHNWIGAKNADGYGTFWIKDRCLGAHRVAWMIANGPIPDGLHVLHNCPGGDNPACCNTRHHFLGTHQQNVADRDAKGRGGSASGLANGAYTKPESRAKGERNGNSKLTTEDVAAMRRLRVETGATYLDIGRKFGVSKAVAHNVITGKTWKHVTPTSASPQEPKRPAPEMTFD